MLIISTFLFLSALHAKKETLFLPQQNLDIYYTLVQYLKNTKETLMLHTKHYNYKALNYHLIQAAKRGVTITIYTTKVSNNPLLDELRLYKNIHIMTRRTIQTTTLSCDDILRFSTILSLDRKLFRSTHALGYFFTDKKALQVH